jgi:hypothetical protein
LDQQEHRFNVTEYFFGRDAERANALLSQPGITPLIALRIVAHVVRFAVHLDAKGGG